MNAVVDRSPLRFRPMVERDMAEALEIENAAYEFPWTPGIFRDCLRVGYLCWIAEGDWRMEGYGIMTVAVGEAHILNLCVRPERRRCGYGRAILGHLLQQAMDHDAENVFLEVRPSNLAAIELYRDQGFAEVGYRRNYYPAHGGREDALILARALRAPW